MLKNSFSIYASILNWCSYLVFRKLLRLEEQSKKMIVSLPFLSRDKPLHRCLSWNRGRSGFVTARAPPLGKGGLPGRSLPPLYRWRAIAASKLSALMKLEISDGLSKSKAFFRIHTWPAASRWSLYQKTHRERKGQERKALEGHKLLLWLKLKTNPEISQIRS